MNTTVIIPAGGKGTRFGGDLPKQYSDLAGEPIIVRTIKVFQETEDVDSIVLSVHSDYYNFMNELVEKYNLDKVKEIAIGGDDRQNSVTNALHTKSVENADIVLVHDAVRPLLTTDLVSRVIEETEEFGAVIPGREPQETIKERNSAGRIIRTYDRSKLATVQTPQGFWQELILSAYKTANETGFIGTDSSSLIEYIGYRVQMIEGEEANIKITTLLDKKIAEMLLAEREELKDQA